MNKNDASIIASLRDEMNKNNASIRNEMNKNNESLRIEISKALTKEEYEKGLETQSKKIAEIFHNTFKTLEKREKNILLKMTK